MRLPSPDDPFYQILSNYVMRIARVVACDHAMGGLMHGRLNDAAQLGGGRRRHLRKNLSALGFIRLRFAGLRARAQALRLSTPAAIVMLLATIVLMAVTTTPPAAAARQAHPVQARKSVPWCVTCMWQRSLTICLRSVT